MNFIPLFRFFTRERHVLRDKGTSEKAFHAQLQTLSLSEGFY